ncbi:MAG: secondary thiamine-phosphate synthase enzyme YjbQ [Anaerolineaceae bacterium]|nr:secondary thiamine-phosphate synthase enzyme YjbQ [Anaerolineaceae bacterium]
MLKTIILQTDPGESLVNITGQLHQAVQESGVKEGICVAYVPHTTAALTVNSAIDPNTSLDIVDEVHRLVPTRVDFHHTFDTPADAAGHVKASIIGGDLSLIITAGDLLLGGSQSVLFFEFDGPRTRKVMVRIMADD